MILSQRSMIGMVFPLAHDTPLVTRDLSPVTCHLSPVTHSQNLDAWASYTVGLMAATGETWKRQGSIG